MLFLLFFAIAIWLSANFETYFGDETVLKETND
jgi:hypothetical protein